MAQPKRATLKLKWPSTISRPPAAPMPASSSSKAQRAERARAALQQLAKTYPVIAQHRPLAIGIDVAIQKREPTISHKTIRHALAIHTGRPAYRRQIVEGAARFDLDGNAVGVVTAKEAAHAKGPRRHGGPGASSAPEPVASEPAAFER